MSSSSSHLRSQMIQAGAGAGKTTRLVETFFNYVEEYESKNKKSPRVVISTFTKKATQELRERLFRYAVDKSKYETLRLLQKPSHVHISTLHGLLVPFLARYGDFTGLNPEVRVVSSFTRELNDRRTLKKIFVQKPELMEILEEFSWDELLMGLEIYVQNRLLYGNVEMDSRQNLEKWVKQSFLDWSEEQTRLQQEFSNTQLNESWKLFLESYFSYAQNWNDVKSNHEKLGRKPSFKKDKPPFSATLHDEFETHREKTKKILSNPLLQETNRIRFGEVHEQFSQVASLFFEESLKSKFESGSLSMSDLETLTLEVIRKDPQVAQKFSNQWDFWMIDEYQDTSPIQVEILDAFVGKKDQFIVGDPQQSIYLFRGARKEVFQEKIKEMKKNGVDLEVVPVNYRSTPQLLGFFNEFFRRISSDFVTMTIPEKRQNIPTESFVKVLKVEESDFEDADVLVLISEIQKQLKAGIPPKDIAVLARTNADLKRVIRLAKEAQLEVECPSLSDYWQRREILDLASLVIFLFNPHDNRNLFVLLRSPWFFVSDERLMSFHAKSSYWWQLRDSDDLQGVYQRLDQLLQVANSWGISSAVLDFVKKTEFLWSSHAIDPTGRREANIWKFISDLREQERQPGVNLLEWLDESMRDESTDVSGQSGEAPPLLQPNRVSLMTVHASKGLEFQHVYILGMSDRPQKSKNQIFNYDTGSRVMSLSIRDDDQKRMYSPITEQTRDDMRVREAEESIRWLYVAMTRAKTTLTMIVDTKSENESWWSVFSLPKDIGLQRVGQAEYYVELRAPEQLKAFENTKGEKQKKSPFEWQSQNQKEKVSPTSLLQTVPAGHSANAPVQALRKAQKGTQVHRLFEALAYNSNHIVPSSWKEAFDYVLQLENPPMKKIFEKGHPEWGFAYIDQSLIHRGAIDLWAELPEAVYIIDYKTGSSKYAEKALQQLRLYSQALLKMQIVEITKPHIRVALYPFEKKIVLERT